MRGVSNGELPQHGWIPRGGFEGRPAGARQAVSATFNEETQLQLELLKITTGIQRQQTPAASCHFPGPGPNLAVAWLLIMMAPDIGRPGIHCS